MVSDLTFLTYFDSKFQDIIQSTIDLEFQDVIQSMSG